MMTSLSTLNTEDMILRLNQAQIIPQQMEFGSRLQSSSLIIELGKKLLQASREGDTNAVRELMSKGAPFTTDWLGTSALHLAAMNAHEATCEVLLRSGISRDTRTKVERTPLHLAAYEGHTAICRLLIQHHAQVDCRDMLRMTPLHWAVEKGHAECAQALVEGGADPGATSKFNKTPLGMAAAAGRQDLLDVLSSALLSRLHGERDYHPHDMEGVEVMMADQDGSTEEVGIVDAELCAEPIAPESIAPEPPCQQGAAQLLRRHGITLLPHDNTNTVVSALQSGRTIVLSDAGKLMLKESESNRILPKSHIQKPVILTSNKLKTPTTTTTTTTITIPQQQPQQQKLKIFTVNGSRVVTIPRQDKPTVVRRVISAPTIKYLPQTKLVPGKSIRFNKVQKPSVVKLNQNNNNNKTATVFRLEELRRLQSEGLLQLRGGGGAGVGAGGALKVLVRKTNLDKLVGTSGTSAPRVPDSNGVKVTRLQEHGAEFDSVDSTDIGVVRAALMTTRTTLEMTQATLETTRATLETTRATLEQRERELDEVRTRLRVYETGGEV